MNSPSRPLLAVLICFLIALTGCVSPPEREALRASGSSSATTPVSPTDGTACAEPIPASPYAASAGNIPSATAPGTPQPRPDLPEFSSVADARAQLPTSATGFVVTDGTTHVVYEKDAPTSADATAVINGVTYATTFTDVVPLLAWDVPADATSTLTTAMELATQRHIGVVRLSKSQSYTVSDELILPAGVTFDGAGATINSTIPDGTKADPKNVFRLNPGVTATTLTNTTIVLAQDSRHTRGVLASAVTNTTISNLTIVNSNVRAIDVVARAGKVDDLKILNNRIQSLPGYDKERGSVAIGVTSGIKEDRFTSTPAPAYDRFVETGTVAETEPTSTRVIISGNHITGAYYGVGLSGVSCSVVSNNFSTMNTRNLSMQDNSHHNRVEDNHFSNSISASIHLAYGSHENTIQRNTIVTDRSSGEGLLQAYQLSHHNTFQNNTVEVTGAAQPNWMLYAGPASDSNIFSGNILSGRAGRAIFAAESIWDHDSATSSEKTDNPHSYMKEKTFRPGDGVRVTYAGGRSGLTGTQVVNNVILPTGTPFYVGAEVSKGASQNPERETANGASKEDDEKKQDERLIGDNTHLILSGNQLAGTDYTIDQALVEHEGSLDGVGKASISYDNKSIGTHHSQVTAQQGDGGDTNLVFDSPEDTATDAGGNDVLNASVDSTLPEGVESLRMLGSKPLQGTGNELPNTIHGNSADNVIDGKGGDDTVAGGQGRDTLTGGAGNDRFVLDGQLNGDVDTITDFTPGQDKIVLPVATFGGLNGDWFAAGEVTATTRVFQQGETLFFDADGSGTLFEPVAVATLPLGVQVTASDFA